MRTRNAATNLVSHCKVLTLVTFHFPTDQDGVRDAGSMEFLRPSGRDNTFMRTSACGTPRPCPMWLDSYVPINVLEIISSPMAE